MDPEKLKELRGKKKLKMSQHELAKALSVSFATVNRWESTKKETHRDIPRETARLLESLDELFDKNGDSDSEVSRDDIREAVEAVGVAGVVARAVMAGWLSTASVMRLALLPTLGWVTGIAGASVMGYAAAMPFFASTKSKGNESSEDKGDIE